MVVSVKVWITNHIPLCENISVFPVLLNGSSASFWIVLSTIYPIYLCLLTSNMEFLFSAFFKSTFFLPSPDDIFSLLLVAGLGTETLIGFLLVQTPAGDRTCILGMCPDGIWDCDLLVHRLLFQSTEPRWPGPNPPFLCTFTSLFYLFEYFKDCLTFHSWIENSFVCCSSAFSWMFVYPVLYEDLWRGVSHLLLPVFHFTIVNKVFMFWILKIIAQKSVYPTNSYHDDGTEVLSFCSV